MTADTFKYAQCVVLALAVALCSCATHRPPPPSNEIDETAYRNHLQQLAGDDFGGRKPGTPGEDKTVSYLVDQFRKLGLKPGNGTSYLQSVPLIEITTANDATLSFSGAKGAHPLVYGKEMVIWSRQQTATVQLRSSDAVFVGFGIVAPDYHWNDYAGIDVHGKTVVVLSNDPGHGSQDPTVFRGNAMSEYGRWAYKIEEAARHGAAAVLMIHDSDAVGFGWNTVQSTWLGAHFVSATAPGAAAPGASVNGEVDGAPLLEGWLQADAARELFLAGGLDYAALTRSAAQPGFKATPMGLQVEAIVHDSVRAVTSSNVIAVAPGGRSKHQYVIYTAHWDSLGAAPPRGTRAVYPGAVDNASGVAGLLTLAQSFARTHPAAERSVAFVATTAAVPDLLGAGYYVEHPTFPLRETAAVIDLDMLLPGGHSRDLNIFGFGNTDLEDTARSMALLQGRETRPDPNPQRGRYYFTDGYRFALRGVPVLYAQSGLDDAARGPRYGQAKLDDYFAQRFRQSSDQYLPDWSVVGALDDLKLYLDVGNTVARVRRYPRWYPNSRYREHHGHSLDTSD